MEEHQYGGQKAGKEGHWSLRERPPHFSIQSQMPKRVPTGSTITTNWLITNWRTSGSTVALVRGHAGKTRVPFAIMERIAGQR